MPDKHYMYYRGVSTWGPALTPSTKQWSLDSATQLRNQSQMTWISNSKSDVIRRAKEQYF